MEKGQKRHLASRLPYNILRKSNSDPLQVGRGVAGAAVLPRRLAV
ncbi:hypothetical protein [Ktedonobacter racemifer]|uniref:Uncharacterized protein n=1 Tax=Ktedonobacter racemifer DSM 44963 TaxID=485913 RepID=D6TSS6_KTERA|nr:hypothetical protein [Ktedonobacter racemifer]EFH83477.1 hypothetical protein Krac_4442 [Ktedonobacter racemifer DSM 44963]